MKKRLTAILAVLGCCVVVNAEELVTDRPDATESTAVVSPGSVQIESGWLYTEDDDAGVERHEGPQTLIRIGLTEVTELRLGWAGTIDEGSDGSSGVGDGEVGFKFHLHDADGRVPETAVLVSVSIPTGDDEFTSDEVDPAVRFAFSGDVTEGVSGGVNLGVEWASDENEDRDSTFIYTVAFGVGLTEGIGAYVEVFGEIGVTADGDAHSVDGGVTWLVAENLQLDALAGVGISGDAEDWFVGAGASVRLPN
jgi:hypothetical protein